MTDVQPPALRDSDLMYLAVKRLERIAEKMQRLEYDSELEAHMRDLDEWFQYILAQRFPDQEAKEPNHEN